MKTSAFTFAVGLRPLVVTRTQYVIQGIEANIIVQTGFGYIQPLWSVFIIVKYVGTYMILKQNSKNLNIVISSFIPTSVGTTKPAIFAVNLKK